MQSGRSGQICPAQPSNFSTSKPDLDLNMWEFNKADENQDKKFEEGVVLLRCSVHDADHAQWLTRRPVRRCVGSRVRAYRLKSTCHTWQDGAPAVHGTRAAAATPAPTGVLAHRPARRLRASLPARAAKGGGRG